MNELIDIDTVVRINAFDGLIFKIVCIPEPKGKFFIGTTERGRQERIYIGDTIVCNCKQKHSFSLLSHDEGCDIRTKILSKQTVTKLK